MLQTFILKYKVSCLVLCAIIMNSCNNTVNHAPKPRAYYRINFLNKEYKPFTNSKSCNYSFLIPSYAEVGPDEANLKEQCWININYPKYNGTLHISYYHTSSNSQLAKLAEDSRKLVFKHTIKAAEINEIYISYLKNRVFGFIYEIEGNAASPLQFYVSDNKSNFLRGALYFNINPNIDFIKPVIDYIRIDINKLLESLQWSSTLNTTKL